MICELHDTLPVQGAAGESGGRYRTADANWSTFDATSPAALCISIHDVAPATWPACRTLVETIHAVAPVPLTFLVVPAYHRLPVTDSRPYEAALGAHLARGDELALHGYCHLDEAPRATDLRGRYLREVFTTGEGEFAALSAAEASQRITLGLDWFARRAWPVQGFVAPAWLLGAGAWQAVRQFPFAWTSTARALHCLQSDTVMSSPTMVYTARNRAGRFLSRHWNARIAARLSEAPLLRLALHPADAGHPVLMRHLQHMLPELLARRTAMTKTGFLMRANLPEKSSST